MVLSGNQNHWTHKHTMDSIYQLLTEHATNGNLNFWTIWKLLNQLVKKINSLIKGASIYNCNKFDHWTGRIPTENLYYYILGNVIALNNWTSFVMKFPSTYHNEYYTINMFYQSQQHLICNLLTKVNCIYAVLIVYDIPFNFLVITVIKNKATI
jgi:hypothetical protein